MSTEEETEEVHKLAFMEKMKEGDGMRKTFDKEKINKLIGDVEEAYGSSKRNSKQYYLKQKYEVIKFGDTKKVISKRNDVSDDILYYVPICEAFDALWRIHKNIGHKGRDLMLKECQKLYANVGIKMKTTGIAVKPIISKNFNQRCQMDLIDMQCMPDGDYKWIFVYQDHFTKFCQLRAIKAKSAVEVANALLDVFSIFGVPVILQSDNGKEFRNEIIEALKVLWSGLQIVHGRARHPQSQGSVERCNGDVKVQLATWMRTNKSKKWSIGLKFVQIQKNQSHHTGIGISPYKGLFGIDTPLGLQTSGIPVEEWKKLKTARELLQLVGQEDDDEFFSDEIEEPPCEDDVFHVDDYDLHADDLESNHSVSQSEVTKPTEITGEASETFDVASNRLLGIRSDIHTNLTKQGEKMVEKSKKYFPQCNIGDIVCLPIPAVDRGPSEPTNLLCKVLSINDHNLHELACEAGTLNVKFARNAFDIAKGKFEITHKEDTMVSVRKAVSELSLGGGQGMVKCNCTAGCKNKRCSCRQNGILCNSRCHGGNTLCVNK